VEEVIGLAAAVPGRTRGVRGPVVIEARGVEKTFRIPEHRIDSFRERATHPFTRVEYREHRALRGVSFDVRQGEFVAIVGRNGSGKSTLVKHLIGLLQPSAGEVRIDGRSIAGRPIHAIARTVGFVFQRPEDQLFERTVEREVGFGPRMLGFDAGLVGRLVDTALGATGLIDRQATNPYDLGLAGRRLVALASVLAMDPAIVVLDEPTAGHDPVGVARIADLVRALAADGRTVVAITHDLRFASDAFERVVVMRDGSVVDDGPPGRILGAGNEALLASTGLA
jgi:energy-coupling factor transport system ATP-binding protein